jgi:hypothetical protein
MERRLNQAPPNPLEKDRISPSQLLRSSHLWYLQGVLRDSPPTPTPEDRHTVVTV